jgi:ABC-type branched-subunit amino acid transport system substrate-binding protein
MQVNLRSVPRKVWIEPNFLAAAAVAAVETHFTAMEAAGTLDPKMVRDAIAQADFESVYGRVRFSEKGQILMPQTVVQIQTNKRLKSLRTDLSITRCIRLLRDKRS